MVGKKFMEHKMKLIDSGGAHINPDQEGDFYFNVGESVYYLSEFIKIKQVRGVEGDGVTHLSNTGVMVIDIDEVNEYVEYKIYTNE